ncbi:endonuclease III [Deferribacterales bacterium Es71-Z0220]|uniref:endonuclease III domain-containing protein n=1 Tax=Deferrivibrio essentukiensis TaxID=2880922 RepID=UPI001F61F24F|nr:endonuclease III [Deferrivibrio essentukiensis]MCB4204368.1 endonuclease III [Deferrivibrio essentukiensis]
MSKDIQAIFKQLEIFYKNENEPSVTKIAKMCNNDPFKVLISTIISLRTKDEVTLKSSLNLFNRADTPEKIIQISVEEIEKLIFPAGFYRKKAVTIKEISKKLVDEYDSLVPDNIDELLKFKGIGRKTATLVMIEGFGKKEVCVDTHVHRISNRMGLVKTKSPNETEIELKKIIPDKYWIKLNKILVVYGQKICKPISPLCSSCFIDKYCDKINIKNER